MNGCSDSAVLSPQTFYLRSTDLLISKLLVRPFPLNIHTFYPPASISLCRDTGSRSAFNIGLIVERSAVLISIGEQVGFVYFGVGSD